KTIFSTVHLIAGMIAAMPLIYYKYRDYAKTKELESMFPVFLRDFIETARGGLTITESFRTVSKNDYKALSKYIRKVSAQLDWGIPLDIVLVNFSKETKSKMIGRIVSSVLESHKFGGNLTDTFEALSQTAVDIDRLKQERLLYLQSQITTGYVIFFVFLGVIIGLEKFLVPTLTTSQPLGGLGGEQLNVAGLAEEFRTIFRNLVLIQGLFAGLAVGKMAEGAVIAGVKHSLIMMFVGGIAFAIFG
ncbi:type II secretion system F family protein, partial [archaeon]